MRSRIVEAIAIFVGGILFATVFFIFAWNQVVPDIFAGAVVQGIIPANITFLQALKLISILSVFGILTLLEYIFSEKGD